MKVGILGSGAVGKALSAGFIRHGYEVMAGSRAPGKLQSWKADISPELQTGNFSEAAEFGEILVLAVKGSAAETTLKLAGPEHLKNKTILDASNPIADTPPENGVLKFFTTQEASLMERLQRLAPEARFVKAFNSVGSAFMVNPAFSSKPTMFICGNNEEAKVQAGKILDAFGWETEDMGSAEAARAIESLCILWCIPGFRESRWSHAFKLLKL